MNNYAKISYSDSSLDASPGNVGKLEDDFLSSDPVSEASGPSFKPPLTIEGQLKHLIDKYNLNVSNDEEAVQIKNYLYKYNYYRLRGYWITLIENDKFKSGVKFQDVIDIMMLDREIRHLLFEITEDIEVDLRTNIAYTLSMKFGPDALTKHKIFCNVDEYNKYFKMKTNIESNVSRAINNSHQCVKHNIEKYGKLPIWASVEVTTFGNLSKLYGCLNDAETRRIISERYYLKENTCKSWLQCLNDLRNACAHHERLYNRKFSYSAKYISAWKDKNVHQNDDNSLFVYILLSLRMIYTIDKDFYRKYFKRFSSILSIYKTVNLEPTSIPSNWKEILVCSIRNLHRN